MSGMLVRAERLDVENPTKSLCSFITEADTDQDNPNTTQRS